MNELIDRLAINIKEHPYVTICTAISVVGFVFSAYNTFIAGETAVREQFTALAATVTTLAANDAKYEKAIILLQQGNAVQAQTNAVQAQINDNLSKHVTSIDNKMDILTRYDLTH